MGRGFLRADFRGIAPKMGSFGGISSTRVVSAKVKGSTSSSSGSSSSSADTDGKVIIF